MFKRVSNVKLYTPAALQRPGRKLPRTQTRACTKREVGGDKAIPRGNQCTALRNRQRTWFRTKMATASPNTSPTRVGITLRISRSSSVASVDSGIGCVRGDRCADVMKFVPWTLESRDNEAAEQRRATKGAATGTGGGTSRVYEKS